MTYANKILVAAGCSHTYGMFMNDKNPETCHDRSWVKKLEIIAGFKNSINLSNFGGSNKRSVRVLTDFVIDNIANIDQYVIILGLTEIARTEFPSQTQTEIPTDFFFDFDKNGYIINMLGPYQIGRLENKQFREFTDTYYGLFSVDAYDIKLINHDMLKLHVLLTHLNAEHYFPIMLGPINNYKKIIANNEIPYIHFNKSSTVDDAKNSGFKVGKDLDPTTDCLHLDHDGNQHIAEGIYRQMKGYNNGI